MSSPAQNILKRQSPSDARLEKLKKLKASDKCYTSTPLKTDMNVSPLSVTSHTSQESPTSAMDPSPQLFNDIDGLEVHIASKTRRRNGISALESMPILTCGDDEKLTNISFSLGFMSVKYNKLTGDGNLGQFSSDPKRCKYTASLEEGVPEALKQVMPNLAKEQSDTIAFIKKWTTTFMEHIYHCDDDKDWIKTKGDLEMEDFVAGANISCLKEKDDEKFINVARSLVNFRNEPNNPRFWRPLREGGCEQISPKYIPHGSIVRVSGRLRAYNVNANMYGVSFDMDRDIIVAYIPPKEAPVDEKKPNGPTLPFIDFTF